MLAERDKGCMDDEMKTALRGYNISWQTREGSPYAAADLLRVSAGSASMIVLMRPESGEVRACGAWSPRSVPAVEPALHRASAAGAWSRLWPGR